jgi:hypothetical protein
MFFLGMAMKASPKKANVLPMLAGFLCFFFLPMIIVPTLCETNANHPLAFEKAGTEHCDAVFEKYERIIRPIPVREQTLKTDGSFPFQFLNNLFNLSSPISRSLVLRC